jgi:hypothetical protein
MNTQCFRCSFTVHSVVDRNLGDTVVRPELCGSCSSRNHDNLLHYVNICISCFSTMATKKVNWYGIVTQVAKTTNAKNLAGESQGSTGRTPRKQLFPSIQSPFITYTPSTRDQDTISPLKHMQPTQLQPLPRSSI